MSAEDATERSYDVAIVGAGLIGLATARALLHSRPGLRVVILEKEAAVAQHQSGHNSGVLHSGIYYPPGSLKAEFCRRGKQALEAYAAEQGIPCERIGKLIVAIDDGELGRLEELERRAQANGVTGLRTLEAAEIADVEPNATGVRALHAAETAIIDYGAVARALADEITALGASVALGVEVRRARPAARGLRLDTTGGTFDTATMIGCAGLQSDRVAASTGVRTDARIIPFRGDYYTLHGEDVELVRGLIYPVPDPAFPFLGVHFTPKIDGSVLAGPNAVLSLARERYRRLSFSARDAGSALAFTGLWRFAARHGRIAAGEVLRDISKRAFVRDMQRYVPNVRSANVTFGPTGIRAQAMSRDGALIDDFLIVGGERTMHVLNAPSPGATSSLAIGAEIAARAERDLIHA